MIDYISKEELENITENIAELPDLKKEIKNLSEEVLKSNIKEIDKTIYLLLHILIEFESYIANLEQIYEILNKMAANYREKINLVINHK